MAHGHLLAWRCTCTDALHVRLHPLHTQHVNTPARALPPCSHSPEHEQIQLLTLIPAGANPAAHTHPYMSIPTLFTLSLSKFNCSHSSLHKYSQPGHTHSCMSTFTCSHSSLHHHSHPAHTHPCTSIPALLTLTVDTPLALHTPHTRSGPAHPSPLRHTLVVPLTPPLPSQPFPVCPGTVPRSPPARAIPHAWHTCIPAHAPGSSLA